VACRWALLAAALAAGVALGACGGQSGGQSDREQLAAEIDAPPLPAELGLVDSTTFTRRGS
jgi:hypothetical protein